MIPTCETVQCSLGKKSLQQIMNSTKILLKYSNNLSIWRRETRVATVRTSAYSNLNDIRVHHWTLFPVCSWMCTACDGFQRILLYYIKVLSLVSQINLKMKEFIFITYPRRMSCPGHIMSYLKDFCPEKTK